MPILFGDAGNARLEVPGVIREAAEAALALLAARAEQETITAAESSLRWTLRISSAQTRFVLACTGPNLPASPPGELVRPEDIARERPFVPAWRLTIHAPLLVLDLAWRPGSTLRIMTFANGDWQRDLAQAARAAKAS